MIDCLFTKQDWVQEVALSHTNRRQFLGSLATTAALTVSADVTSFGSMRRLRINAAMQGAPAHDRLQPDWYKNKIAQVQQEMQKRKLDTLLMLNAKNVIYTTGYFHLSTERPLAALVPKSGDPVLFIPELEADQVKLWWIKDYESYFDFPGPENRVRWIFERVARRGFDRGRIGVEESRPSRMHQMKLGAPKAAIVDAGDIVENLRLVKDEDEIRIMRRAMTYADFKVQAGREFVQ